MKNEIGRIKASVTVAILCMIVMVFLSFFFTFPEKTMATQGTDGWVYYDAWGNKYYHDIYTWGDSTNVSAEIKIPFNFGKPDMCYSWAWDTEAAAGDEAYADDEVFWIDRSSWATYADIATDSRSTMNIIRKEHTTNDGAEDGVIVDFVLIQFNH